MVNELAAMNFLTATSCWEICSKKLNLEKLSDEDINDILLNFKISLRNGEEALRHDPNNPQVKGFVEALRYYYNGLDNLDTSESNQALFLCLRGKISFFTSFEMVQVSGKVHTQEFFDVTVKSAIEVTKEMSMPSLQKAIAIKPNYTAAKNALTEIQSFLLTLDNTKHQPQTQAMQLSKAANQTMDSMAAECQKPTFDYRVYMPKITQHIYSIESFLSNKNSGGMLDSKTKSLLQWKLSQLYGRRAEGNFLSGDNKDTLRQALHDIDVALSVSDECIIAFSDESVSEVRGSMLNLKSSIEKKIGKCFIATAAYGSPLSPNVEVLRQFRNARLRKNPAGRWFIKVYERYSPPLADWIAVRPTICQLVRLVLFPIVYIVRFWSK